MTKNEYYATINEPGEEGGSEADDLVGEDVYPGDRKGDVDNLRAYVQEEADGELPGEEAAVQSRFSWAACVEPG